MSPEAELAGALDAAAEPVTLWWRDDDAGRNHPRLQRLLDLAVKHQAPVALAVVPAWLDPACAARLIDCTFATALQHGHAHNDYAEPGAKKIELGGTADRPRLLAQLEQGRELLAGTFGIRFEPVLVPPWNRIAGDLLPHLTSMGFTALSTFGPRDGALPYGLRQVNTHLDLIRWHEGRRPLTLAEAAAALAGLIRAGLPEPIGILSHHLDCDDEAFRTLDRLLQVVQDHPRARLAASAELFRRA